MDLVRHSTAFMGIITNRLRLIEDFNPFRKKVCNTVPVSGAKGEDVGFGWILTIASSEKERKCDMRWVSDWTALPIELLECIANRLTLIEDLNAFRGVCTSWRAIEAKFVSQVPLLMLADNDGSNEREFYSLAKRRICMRVPFPWAIGKRCINVGFGWILTIASSGEVCLLKPFSSSIIELPNINTFPKYQAMKAICFIKGALLTADPLETLNFKVVVALHEHYGFWKNEEEKWTSINSRGFGMLYSRERGTMYTFDFKRHLLFWDPHGTDLTKPQGQVKVDNLPTGNSIDSMHYLAESTDGELLMIIRNYTTYFDCVTWTYHFKVLRVNLVKEECEEIHDLGKDAIFVANHAAMSVDTTKFQGVLRPNTIYFTDDCYLSFGRPLGKDIGMYNVKDRSIERFSVESLSRISPPLWVFL